MAKERKHPVLNSLKGRVREEGETYRSLSKKTGMSVDSLNNKLNGYSAIDSDDVELISAALNIGPDDILTYFFPHLLRNATKKTG